MLATSMKPARDGNFRFFEVRFEYFLLIKYSNGRSNTGAGIEISNWLKENVSGGYFFRANFVLFENHDDALLCYLRFKG